MTSELVVTRKCVQVSRMLPGGLSVVGVFLLTPPEGAKEAQNTLRRVNTHTDTYTHTHTHTYIHTHTGKYTCSTVHVCVAGVCGGQAHLWLSSVEPVRG